MKRIVLITALLALTVVWGTHAQELVTLTTPIAKASIPSYAVDTILLDVRRSAIVVSLSAPTGDVLVKTYDGGTTPTGATLLHNLNTGNFSTLYGIELDRELGTADRDQRFTTARRKAAINAGQLEFVKRTECLQRQASVTLVDATQEVDLEASVTDFGWIAKQGISIAITSGTTTRYLEGDDLEVTSVANLNVEEPGWRAEVRARRARSTSAAKAARSTSGCIPSRRSRPGIPGSPSCPTSSSRRT
jgi:hypothetical protein